MDATRFNRVEDELFPALAEEGRAILGFHQRCYWSDVGNPAAYLGVNLDLLHGAIPARLPAGWPADEIMATGSTVEDGASILAPALIGPGTTVARGALVQGPAVIGSACAVASGAEVSGSVLWDGVTIGEEATVRRSILASGVRIGARAIVEDAIVAHDATVGEGERLPPGSRLEPGDRYIATAGAR